MIDARPDLPYYAVIFTSIRTEINEDYLQINDDLIALAKNNPGYIGEESSRNEFGVSVSYWKDMNSISQWKQETDHLWAQQKGRDTWYTRYRVRICKVERDYEFFKAKGYV